MVPIQLKENWDMPKKYSPELRERAVRLVLERHAVEGGPRSRSIRVIAA